MPVARSALGYGAAYRVAAVATGQSFDEGTDTGTQWFVRPQGSVYGTGTGTSWTNAWPGFAGIVWASVSAGDTIWIAGGTYTELLSPAKTGTSGSPIKIRRARSDSAQCTGGSGWSAGFDANVVHTGFTEFEDGINYIIISGAKSQSGGVDDVPSSYGWKIDFSARTTGGGVTWWGNGSNNTIRWLEMVGPGLITTTGDMRAIDMTPPTTSPGCTGNRIAHVWGHDWESFAYATDCAAPIFEYCIVEDLGVVNSASFHPDGIIAWACPNGIVRYCTFRKGPNGLGCGEGVFFQQFGNATGWQIYGCVFQNLDLEGEKAIEISAAVGAIKIYNNTFLNIPIGSIYTSDTPSATGGEQTNNFLYNTTLATGISGMTNTTNVTAGSSAAFVNYAGGDFRPVSTIGAGFARNAGTALTADGFINKDRNGNTRGADGAWDVGAYEA